MVLCIGRAPAPLMKPLDSGRAADTRSQRADKAWSIGSGKRYVPGWVRDFEALEVFLGPVAREGEGEESWLTDQALLRPAPLPSKAEKKPLGWVRNPLPTSRGV